MLRGNNDTRNAQALGKISMNSTAPSVLSRPNDFRPFFIPSPPAATSTGITYGMPPSSDISTGGTSTAGTLTGGTLTGGTLTGGTSMGGTFPAMPLNQQIFAATHIAFTATHSADRQIFDAATDVTTHAAFTPPPSTDIQQIFDAIQALYLSTNTPRDRQIAQRLTVVYRDALAEDQHIRPASFGQFADFFLEHTQLSLPKITLTPDGTLRARWINGPSNFVAIEFTGEPLAKLVAEIPRENDLTATHFNSEPLKTIVSVARAIGALFT
jgi:hypothetical protein